MFSKRIRLLSLVLLTLLNSLTLGAVETRYNATIQQGQTYLFGCQTYTADATSYETLTAFDGSDSIVHLILSVQQPAPVIEDIEVAYTATINEGETYLFGCTPYTTEGTYTETLPRTSVLGDSIIHLTLSVTPLPVIEDIEVAYTATINEGETYLFGCTPYTTEGTYTETLPRTNVLGDSIIHLTLSVTPLPVIEDIEVAYSATINEGETYLFGCTPYTTEGTYTETLPRTSVLGDSIIHLTLNVTPLPVIEDIEVAYTATINEGETYLFGCTPYTTEGTYTETLPRTSVLGDSIIHLTLSVTPLPIIENIEVEYTAAICEGDTYLFGCTPYTEAGTYTETLPRTSVLGDSIITLHLTYNPILYDDTAASFCEGSSFTWHDVEYSAAGDYPYTYTSTVTGCDSIVTLHLSINPTLTGDTAASFCEGSSFTWHDVEYSAAGDYPYTYTSTVTGCDSIVTLHLSINPTLTGDTAASFCEGSSFTWHEVEYSAAGDYPYTYTSTVTGCDSIVTLHLSINPTLTGDTAASFCEGSSFTWHEVEYSAAGDYPYTYTSTVTGCDSIVTMHLTMNPILYDDTVASFCEGSSFTWHDVEYSAAGDYPYTYTSTVTGCDSIVTMHLTMNPTYAVELTDTILDGQTYTLNDETYSAAGDYVQHLTSKVTGCDSVVTLHLKLNHVEIDQVIVAEHCADDGVMDISVSLQGTVHKSQLLFDNAAHQAGFEDAVLPIDRFGLITMPFQARAGRYTATLQLLWRGQVVATTSVPISLLYPSSVLEQAWNDVIAVLTHDYNGGYDFIAFQWYENGVLLVGETHSYIYRPLLMGADYTALLTEQNGTQMMTCPLTATPQTDITLYPTVVTPQQMIHCYVSEAADLRLYDTMGKQMLSQPLTAGDNLFRAPAQQGIYVVKVTTAIGTERVYKLMIQ